MNRTRLCVCLLVCLGSVAVYGAGTELSGAQSKPRPTQQRLGSVHGRVFAVTKGGDFKPARLAKVYLIFETKTVGHKVDPSAANEETAGLVFLKKHLEQVKQVNSEVLDKSNNSLVSSETLDTFSCKAGLLGVDEAIVATLDWSQAKPHQGQVLFTNADEEGNFVFPKVRTGKYNVIARGHAGINDAYWKQDVWVQPGEAVTVKVATVESACVTSE
jgi:hypothetical protein